MEPLLVNQIWMLSNRIGRRIENPTNTIYFICKAGVPSIRLKDVTYGQFVYTMLPKKAKTNQTCFIVGTDHINHADKVITPTTNMMVAKCLFNSIISTKGAKFMTMEISNFYLMNRRCGGAHTEIYYRAMKTTTWYDLQ